jgi:hypothetical protein
VEEYIYLWHARNLLGAINGRSPWGPLANKELTLGSVLAWPLWIIYHARLQNNGTGKRLAGTEESGATVSAEVRSDALASISSLSDSLWRTCLKTELERLQREVKSSRTYR